MSEVLSNEGAADLISNGNLDKLRGDSEWEEVGRIHRTNLLEQHRLADSQLQAGVSVDDLRWAVDDGPNLILFKKKKPEGTVEDLKKEVQEKVVGVATAE